MLLVLSNIIRFRRNSTLFTDRSSFSFECLYRRDAGSSSCLKTDSFAVTWSKEAHVHALQPFSLFRGERGIKDTPTRTLR